jgi:hypothetical protein
LNTSKPARSPAASLTKVERLAIVNDPLEVCGTGQGGFSQPVAQKPAQNAI